MIVRRLISVVLLALFATYERHFWVDGVRMSFWDHKPYPILGPLWFLANSDPRDDWIGIGLLVIMVPGLLAYVTWPNRTTLIITLVTFLAWIMPGVFHSLDSLP